MNTLNWPRSHWEPLPRRNPAWWRASWPQGSRGVPSRPLDGQGFIYHQNGHVQSPTDRHLWRGGTEWCIKLGSFFTVFLYTKMWLTSSTASNAPLNDLWAVTTLSKVSFSTSQSPSAWPHNFSEIVTAVKSTLENHLEYLSERLISFYLFSEIASIAKKNAMKRIMLKTIRSRPEDSVEMIQQVPFTSNFCGIRP